MTQPINPVDHDGPEPYTVSISQEQLQRLSDDPNIANIVHMMDRVGAHQFARTLELKYYRPGTQRNDDYNITMVGDFPSGTKMAWIIIHIPVNDLPIAEQVAKETGMRLAHGSPMVLGGGQPERFPIHGDRVWTLENGHNSLAYEGPEGRAKLSKIEDDAIEQLEREHEVWMDEQQKFWHDGRWWFRAQGPDDPVLKTAHRSFTRPDTKGDNVVWWTYDPSNPTHPALG